MQPIGQRRTLRHSRFFSPITLLTNLMIVIQHQRYAVLVRSMSLALPSRRSQTHSSTTMTTMMMMTTATTTRRRIQRMPPPSSLRKFSTNAAVNVSVRIQQQQLSVLTRTMVHKMRLSELKEELERRGFNVSSFVKLKRPDLVSMLLTEVTKVSTVSSTKTNDDLDHGVTDKSTKSGGTNTNNISDGNVLSSANTEADGTSKRVGRLSVEHFPIHKVQFDPNTTYAISVRGVTVYGKNGSGVGLVLRECNNHTIVWQGQKYYSGYRSNFESDYTAIVLALRFALQSFHLKNVQVHIANVIIVNQIIGNVPVTKPTLQLLLGQVSQLLKENESSTSSVVFLAAESERLGPETALALDALNTKNSFNLNEENDHQLTVDPMIEILGLQNMTYDMKLPKKLEDDQQYTLKFKEFLKPGEVVINPNTTYTLRFDGGSRGNPGVAGAGMVLYDDQNREIWRGVKYLGRKMSNNLAEYTALNVGLSYALSMGIERIRCEGDSQLVIKQLNGVYQVKSDNLRGLFHETKTLIQKFTSCEVHHIRRELNSRADELANQAMTTKTDYGLNEQLAS